MPEFSFCAAQPISHIFAKVRDVAQLSLSVTMCLFIAVRFLKESMRMYRVTKRFQLALYISFLAKEGILYFFTYVQVFHAVGLTGHS